MPNPRYQALRIWFKLTTKYGGDVSKVTDCARISLEFATAEGLERAAKFVLKAASTFKNRVANPTDEGYRDLMFTVLIGGHVCEVFAAPPPPGCPAALQRTTALHGVGAWPAALHSACAHASALGGRQGRGGLLALAARVRCGGRALRGPPTALTRCHARCRGRSSCTWWR